MNILIVDDHPLTCQGLAALLMATQQQAQVQSAHTVVQAQLALQKSPHPTGYFWTSICRKILNTSFFMNCVQPRGLVEPY